MKKLLFSLVAVLLSVAIVSAQSDPVDLPATTLIPHYRLAVGYSTTTVLVFPAAVRPIDRGDRDILAVKQPGVENVLKVKANRRNFTPTNLHVFTSDGRIYAFDIFYTDSMASSRDLTRLIDPKDAGSFRSTVVLSDQLMNDLQLTTSISKMKDSVRHGRIVSVRHEGMTLTLQGIAQQGPLMFFRLQLHNRSNLPYRVDFIRCYIRDREKARRTSIQEKEVAFVYQDSLPILAGHGEHAFVIALPIFTLANGKEGILEVHEVNGGRSLALHLHNRMILRAQPL